MNGSDLVVDESYWSEQKNFVHNAGYHSIYGIDKKIDKYISKLKELHTTAIMEGDTAQALEAFISCAEKLKQTTRDITSEIKDRIANYLQEIDEQDEYLF